MSASIPRVTSSRAPRADARAGLAWLAMLAAVMGAATFSPSSARVAADVEARARVAAQDRELARAKDWLVIAAERTLATPTPSDEALAHAALAVRALSASRGDVAEALCAKLATRQNGDGSFGSAGGSAPLTWLAAGALTAARGDDDGAAARAFAWLLSSRAASRTAPSGMVSGDAFSRARQFLRTARADTRTGDADEAREVAFVAGGPIDLRESYAAALESKPAARTAPAARWLADPMLDLAISVAVLDHYRTSVEAALLAEATRPVADLRARLAELRHAPSGAWSSEPGGDPSVLATACALTVVDTLERWRADEVTLPGDTALGERTAPNDCTACHATLQPVQTADWARSSHAAHGVGCADCHGENHSTIFREAGRVTTATCGRCHAEALEQFRTSRHARAEETLVASALYAATPAAARASCHACHDIGRRESDGASGNCNHCHSGHAFDAREAREPQACTLCHTGDDYPQDDAYRLSKHGALYATARDAQRSPTCVTCHQPGGRHDDGFGITIGGSGVGAAREGDAAPFDVARLSHAEFAARRTEMVSVCVQCHSSRFSESSLRKADELKREGDLAVLEAERLLRELHAEGCFGASTELEIGPHFARPAPNQPGAELLERFYEMWRFRHATAWKGAYHQSASVANQGSGAGVAEDLEWIRAEAARWRAQRRTEKGGSR